MENFKKTYILAEMAASHEGKVKTGEFIIESAAKAKADGILFQIIDLDSYIIPADADYEDVKSFSLGQTDWESLIAKANQSGLDVWANVFDLKSQRFCQNQKIKGFKLHSSNLENEELVREVAKSKKEILLCVGGLEEGEIKKTLKLISSINKKAKIYLMYGLQNFPTKPQDINLNFIKKLSRDFSLPFGYQDHSEPESAASTYLPILFLANGASIIEKHITYDRSLKGQDYESALNPDEFAEFVRDIRIVEKIINKNYDELSPGELKYREYKTVIKIVAKNKILASEKFSKNNITIMRAKKGEVNGSLKNQLLNKKAKFSYKKFEPIKREELFKTGIFITARLKSKRLPFKVIKPILGKPLIEWLVERLKRCEIYPVVMMTSTNQQDTPLVEIAKKNKIDYFQGSEDDVLLRMRDCAREFKVDLIISVTADDPLKEPIFIKEIVQKYLDEKFDFCEIEGLPNGCESYAVSKKALEKVCKIKNDSDTEIWGDYFRKSGIFKCTVIKVKDQNIFRPQYRVTVDTPEDFKLVSKIFAILLKEKEYFNVYDVCKLLDGNPNLVKINSHVQQKPAPKIKIYQRS